MTQASNQLHRLASWCGRYRRTHGCWPDLQQLVAQADDLPALDPWGRPFRVESGADGSRAWVSSDGPDGDCGTDDDSVSPAPAVDRH